MNFKINDKNIGDGHPVFFIAEAGVNHNGSIKLGKELINAAALAGADAVKFQTFQTKNIILTDAPKSSYHLETTGGDETQSWYELLKTQEMSKAMHIELMDHCATKDIIFMSTPYDEESVDLLCELGVPAIKIASTDTNNTPFLEYVAKKGLPMILSSAMANMDEVKTAIRVVRDCDLESVAMLQCTGNYPSKLEDSNLRVMHTYRKILKCVVGYSDHTKELINPIAATAMGANIIEKHFTIDRTLSGPDHRMSLEPKELESTIEAIRSTEKAMGSSKKIVLPQETENRLKLRKSIVSNVRILKGQIITKNMLGVKRPGTGLSPTTLNSLIGKKAQNDIAQGVLILPEMIK